MINADDIFRELRAMSLLLGQAANGSGGSLAAARHKLACLMDPVRELAAEGPAVMVRGDRSPTEHDTFLDIMRRGEPYPHPFGRVYFDREKLVAVFNKPVTREEFFSLFGTPSCRVIDMESTSHDQQMRYAKVQILGWGPVGDAHSG